MKIHRLICACALLLPLSLRAQDDAVDPLSNEAIEAAIRAFNSQRQPESPNEVKVVLEPEDPKPAEAREPADDGDGKSAPDATAGPDAVPAPDAAAEAEPSTPDALPQEPAADEGKPVLVTGKPPSSPDLIDVTGLGQDGPASGSSPRESIRIRVEKVRDGSGQLEPNKVKLLAPFPPKPLMEAPEGWHLANAGDAPAFEREVELAPGKTITLSIPPHVLAPDIDGKEHFQVQEPGFQASQGYRQSDTVPAILSRSIQQLETDSRQIGAAVDRLQELLVALPKPEGAKPLPEATNAKPRKP